MYFSFCFKNFLSCSFIARAFTSKTASLLLALLTSHLLQNWEQQRAGIRAAAGGFGTARAAPPTPPSDFMNYTSSSSCAPQPGTSRENFYAPNPLNSPMSCPTAPHACGFTGPLSSLASPGGTGTGGAAASTPVLRSHIFLPLSPFFSAHTAHSCPPHTIAQSSRPTGRAVNHSKLGAHFAASRCRPLRTAGGRGGDRYEVRWGCRTQGTRLLLHAAQFAFTHIA